VTLFIPTRRTVATVIFSLAARTLSASLPLLLDRFLEATRIEGSVVECGMVHSAVETHTGWTLEVRVRAGDGTDLGVIEIMTIVIVEMVVMTVVIVGILHCVLH